MGRLLRLGLAAAALTMVSSSVLHASGGSCLPRALTPAEKQAGERVAARLRPLLPPAPPGWRADGPDVTDIASGSCLDPVKHKSVPQPVSVQVRRTFRREAAPAPAPAPVERPAPVDGKEDARRTERARALEQQIAELQRREAAATAAYQAARGAGDSQGQKVAATELREIRMAMGQPRKELREIREAERQQRAAVTAAGHDAAVAQNRAMLANRTIARVSINTNSGRALARASKVVEVPGVPLAISRPAFSMNLLFGHGWIHQGHEAFRPWDPTAPTSRVQDVNVRIEGTEEVMQTLVGALDVKALDAVIER